MYLQKKNNNKSIKSVNNNIPNQLITVDITATTSINEELLNQVSTIRQRDKEKIHWK